MRAIWRGRVIAESDDTITVEGNHYFPPSAVDRACVTDSDQHTVCSWKGRAHYYHLVVDGEELENAAWYYPEPKQAAAKIRDHVAFFPAVDVVE